MTFSITKYFLGSNKGIKWDSPRLGYPIVSIFLGSHLSSWFSTAWMTSVCSCAANVTRISADSRLQCTGCVCTGRSFSSDGCVKWMKAWEMDCIPRAPSKEHAGKSLAESAVTPRWGRVCSVSASLSIQLHCSWLPALETGKKNQYLERWDWIGHRSWVFTWGSQARPSEGDALTKG